MTFITCDYKWENGYDPMVSATICIQGAMILFKFKFLNCKLFTSNLIFHPPLGNRDSYFHDVSTPTIATDKLPDCTLFKPSKPSFKLSSLTF